MERKRFIWNAKNFLRNAKKNHMDAKDTYGTQDTTECVARSGIDSCVFFLQEGRESKTRKGRLYISGEGRGEWKPKLNLEQ